MRRILVEWLIELYDELSLSAQVLLTGVQHVDRFLSTEVSPVTICVSIVAYTHTNTLTTKSI